MQLTERSERRGVLLRASLPLTLEYFLESLQREIGPMGCEVSVAISYQVRLAARSLGAFLSAPFLIDYRQVMGIRRSASQLARIDVSGWRSPPSWLAAVCHGS